MYDIKQLYASCRASAQQMFIEEFTMLMIIKFLCAIKFTDLAFREKFGLDLGDLSILKSNIST